MHQCSANQGARFLRVRKITPKKVLQNFAGLCEEEVKSCGCMRVVFELLQTPLIPIKMEALLEQCVPPRDAQDLNGPHSCRIFWQCWADSSCTHRAYRNLWKCSVATTKSTPNQSRWPSRDRRIRPVINGEKSEAQ